jgi:hypothetical protein
LIATCSLVLAAVPAAADTLLSAGFSGMTAGQPVGTGGPTVGEPDNIQGCVATIRGTPFPTTCLEMDDENSVGSGAVHFGFLDDAEVTTGVVEISAKFWFTEYESFTFSVREPHFAAHSFTDVYFGEDGSVFVNDAAGPAGVVGAYQLGRAFEMFIIHDLDAGTYDIWWDGALTLNDRAHGIVGHGVGGLYAGIDWDPDVDGVFYMDDLHVTTGPFTANESMTWGAVKTIWR